MFNIEIINFTKQPAPNSSLKDLASFAARRWHQAGELSVVLGGDKRLRSLNRLFRHKDKSTDVLTFSAPAGTPGALGEIFINLQDCRRPHKYLEVFLEKKSFSYILFFLLLHGLLHLTGENDDTEQGRRRMIALGEKMLSDWQKNGIIKKKLDI